LVVELKPALHVVQDPLSQTWLSPQAVPFASGPPLVQSCTPFAQLITPAEQGLLVRVQAAPAVHVTQTPVWQTAFGPQLWPFGTGSPVSEQADWPLEQSVRPMWQTSAGVQKMPAEQFTQRPSSQTKFAPQIVPSGAAGVLQSPFWGLHVPAATHAAGCGAQLTGFDPVQIPCSQRSVCVHRLPSSQGTPSRPGAPVSLQTGAPVEQSVLPWWQGLRGAQAAPSAQATQAPLSLQTSPGAQGVPAAAVREQ
jgi:hypothetical protein